MRRQLTMTALLLCLPLTAAAQPVVVDPQVLQQMQETIRQQQQQLQQQAEQIKTQAEVLQRLQQQISTLQQAAVPVAKPVQAAPSTPLPTITSGNDKIKLAISGQINRAVVVANDGYNSTLYHVDNTVSNSRFRLVGTAGINSDLTLGTRLEVAVSPDRSSAVSQQQKTLSDTYFDQRWVEM